MNLGFVCQQTHPSAVVADPLAESVSGQFRIGSVGAKKKKTMRWSLILVGQMRSLRHPVVQLHMQSMILRVIHPDIYAHISPLYYKALHSDSEAPMPKLLQPHVVYWNGSVIDADMRPEKINGRRRRASPHSLCSIDYQEAILRSILQRWHVCMRHMLLRELRMGTRYDYVLRARPDLHYGAALLPHLLSPTTAVVTDSDLFWIAPRRVAIELLNVTTCEHASCNPHMACMDEIAHEQGVVIHEPCPHNFGTNRTLASVPCVAYAQIWRDRTDAELSMFTA